VFSLYFQLAVVMLLTRSSLSDIAAHDLSVFRILDQAYLKIDSAGLAYAPLHFHTGGVREFLSTLRNHAMLVRSVSRRFKIYLRLATFFVI